MDGGPPLRGKDTAVEVDRGRFGKLTGSAFQPRSHIWALLRRIDLYFGNSDFHLFGFSPSRPKYAHQPSFLRPCGVADGDIHSRRVSLVDRDTERSRRGPGGLSGSIFSPKLGDFGPFVLSSPGASRTRNEGVSVRPRIGAPPPGKKMDEP